MTKENSGMELSSAELEGRLTAQRHVLQWLLTYVADKDKAAVDGLLTNLNETWPPQDHQEDPGAVPTSSFAIFAAATAEMRQLLEPVKETQRRDADEDE
ncbi:hypothetical protein [Maritalea mediterranea]|uniref:Uncharacterized protein n=1 Tax=Maritalea mediterranea TaxID=2909667 RepID=A0ABS9EAQ4_9HYPH|nr:hypothetical protein [Maritalea mediterranea]MCF4098508.1 hypothetical protein [Maritalea mediterranea]